MNIVAGEIDRKIREEELMDFLPARIFDFHCHVVNSNYIPPGCLPPGIQEAGAGGADELKKHNEMLFPGIPVASLVTGWPDRHADIEGQNIFLAGQVAGEDALYMLLLVSPGTKPEQLAAQIDRTNAAGLKPYKCFSGMDPENSRIIDYLPEEQLAIADSYNLVVTLHLSKKKGIADGTNFADILSLAGKYPGITWNLAHCGRSFIPEYLEQADPPWGEFRGLKIFFDVSAVTDAEVMFLVINGAGPEKILFGSDNPVGLLRGRCAGFGYDWLFIRETDFRFDELKESYGGIRPTFTVYEQLRSLRRACGRAGLSGSDIQDIFYKNAESVLANRYGK